MTNLNFCKGRQAVFENLRLNSLSSLNSVSLYIFHYTVECGIS